MIKLVVFDLDGTLLETIGDLGASCNAVLRRYGLPEHTYEEYRHFVGNGVRKLCERALPEAWRSPERVEQVRREFVEYYTTHIDRHTVAYPGIPQLLERLLERGVQVAVVSNKFQQGTSLLIERFFPGIPFVAVLGQCEGVPLKPDPTADLQVLSRAGVAPEEALHVGDTATDIAAARAAGMGTVGVTWGFRSREELLSAGADAVIDHAEQLLDLLD